ncbi:hypothetical protein NB713_003773 [Xanthomonas sacchari]|nr:hypothetical protein [Xanthomonas sacchari]
MPTCSPIACCATATPAPTRCATSRRRRPRNWIPRTTTGACRGPPSSAPANAPTPCRCTRTGVPAAIARSRRSRSWARTNWCGAAAKACSAAGCRRCARWCRPVRAATTTSCCSPTCWPRTASWCRPGTAVRWSSTARSARSCTATAIPTTRRGAARAAPRISTAACSPSPATGRRSSPTPCRRKPRMRVGATWRASPSPANWWCVRAAPIPSTVRWTATITATSTTASRTPSPVRCTPTWSGAASPRPRRCWTAISATSCRPTAWSTCAARRPASSG